MRRSKKALGKKRVQGGKTQKTKKKRGTKRAQPFFVRALRRAKGPKTSLLKIETPARPKSSLPPKTLGDRKTPRAQQEKMSKPTNSFEIARTNAVWKGFWNNMADDESM